MTKKKELRALQEIKKLAKLRFHSILTEKYEYYNSELIVFCQLHKTKHVTTFHKYKKTTLGCPCCAKVSKKKPRNKRTKEKISKSLKNKPKKYTSWLLGKTGPAHPSYKHGKGNTRASNPNEVVSLKTWKQQVFILYEYKCFITNKFNTKKTPLVCHHLDSWDIHPNRPYDVNNGVVLQREIHLAFHREFGFGKNTTGQFEKFCHNNFNISVFPWKKGNQEPSFTIIKKK